ncbi:peptidoglycan DD-metalloendopeptidase family protein [Candidatus Kaiserbacteria bacterium]|nr:peptidoglycan DD-metalloendopeptidase family protein [Candidatus Kaiserbacteria bacterium]
MQSRRELLAFICGFLIIPTLMLGTDFASANSEIKQLQSEIKDRNDRLQEIEKEIQKFELALLEVGSEKQTLQKAINQLELERKKVRADISYTENKINTTDLELNKLVLEITKTEQEIKQHKEAIAEIIRSLDENEALSMVELLLSQKKLSEFWNALESKETMRNTMTETLESLSELKVILTDKRDMTTERRAELIQLKNQYDDQSVVLQNNKTEQSQLLTATKNQEANYQALLQEKKDAQEKLLKEVRDFEAKLQFILDPNTIPPKGTTVFNWPLANIVITQYFGGSEFAKRNPQIYGGRAYHPGVDFGAPRGTQIMAPLAGTVRATGNTDLVPGCYSWGKWTLIDHANGLTTLYAHQDVISVSPGEQVKTGQIIGYVGNTGYSTGPHLHFTVYAKSGVSVRKFNEIKAVTSCGAASTPVAATDAYIDPMDYLPG